MAEAERRGNDWWAEVVIGFPAFIRHHSGRGFKPIVRVPYDFNMPFDFGRTDGRESVHRGWHEGDGDWDSVQVGERIFLYCEDDAPSFGFLATVIEVGDDELFIDVESRPRFDAWVDAKDADMGLPPRGWLAPVTTWRCEHLTIGGRLSKSPFCGQCDSTLSPNSLTA